MCVRRFPFEELSSSIFTKSSLAFITIFFFLITDGAAISLCFMKTLLFVIASQLVTNIYEVFSFLPCSLGGVFYQSLYILFSLCQQMSAMLEHCQCSFAWGCVSDICARKCIKKYCPLGNILIIWSLKIISFDIAYCQ